MILYLYALTDGLGASDLHNLTGVIGENFAGLEVEGITAIGSWMERVPPLTREMLSAQYTLLGRLHELASALLPMRFGSFVRDDEAAQAFLDGHRDALRRQLALVRGRDQMTLRILGATGPPSRPRSRRRSPVMLERAEADATGEGTRYLKTRAAKATPPEIVPLIEALKPLQQATRIETARHAGVLATVYQLVDRGSATTYQHAAERAAAAVPSVTVRISGPSPAYAFAFTDR